MNNTKSSSAFAVDQLPWAVRALLGCATAALGVALTYAIPPLRAFPFLLAFPIVILSAWFLGMWGAICCALTDAFLVDAFLTKSQIRFSMGNAPEALRLFVFILLSVLLGYTIRRSAQQRALLDMQEWQQRLTLANAERHQAEERARASEALRDRDDMLQIALHANSMGLWVWDLKNAKYHWSDEVYRIIGAEPGLVEPSPAAWSKFIHPDDAERTREAVRQTCDGGTDYHQQYRVIWPDKSVHWLESQGKCQRDAQGNVTRVVGVITDISSRKVADEAMLQAEKLAVAGRLAASVAHEINNPLEAVTNLLYLIVHAQTLDTTRAQARLALDELMRVSLITQQTLKFHRQPGKPAIVKLSDILHTVLALFRARLRSSSIAVEVQAKREASVACMPSEMQQIFANLITNAIEAIPGSGRLVIRLQPSRDWREGSTAGMRITFCDSGVGMSPATMRQIFEPFFTTKTGTGTGLGMWVVSQLIERHRGRIRVRSSQDPTRSGTAFSIFLPLTNPSANDSAASSDSQ